MDPEVEKKKKEVKIAGELKKIIIKAAWLAPMRGWSSRHM